MKKFLLVLLIITGALIAALVYERLFVENTFGPAAIMGAIALGGIFLFVLTSLLLYGTRHREIVVRIWLAATSTAVAYIVLDLAAGFILIKPLSPALVPDEYVHHKLLPNSYSKLEQQDFSYIQRVNNLGLRGKDLKVEKQANTYRIVMLGDSFTMGKGVEDNETFSVLLDKMLNEKDAAACDGKSFEIVNAGVDSYAPVLSFIQLKRNIEPLQPDLVVLNLDVSDLVQETAYRQGAVRDANGEIVAVPLLEDTSSLTEKIRDWIDHHLFFTRAAIYYTTKSFGYKELAVRDVTTRANYEIVAHTLADDTVQRDEQWRNIFDSISKMKRYADGKNIGFVLSIYPWAHQVSDTEWMPGRYTFMPEGAVASDRNLRIVSEFAAQNGIPLANMFPTFRAYKGENPLYLKHDPHWTPAGQEVMAKGLLEYLQNSYVKNWCGNN